MGQQPNIEVEASDLPLEEPERGVERRWVPNRPGEITAPEDMPRGDAFGRPGPDTGWALRLLRRTAYDRGDRPGILADVVTALVGARAAAYGRSPVPQDIEAALSVLGLRPQDMDPASVAQLATRREDWLDEVPHDPWPGMSALQSIPISLLKETPARIRARLDVQPTLVGESGH